MSSAYTLMTRLRSAATGAVLAIMCLQSPAAGAPVNNLRVGVPAEDPAYRLGTSTVVQGFVENEGPDPSVDGELYIYVSHPADVLGGMKSDPSKKAGAGGTVCPTEPGQYATQAHCHFDRLSRGERMYVLVRVEIAPANPNWDYQSDAVTLKAFSKTPGWNTGNTKNESQQRIVFCHSTKSSLAGCKDAK